jgi:hypothetical protein
MEDERMLVEADLYSLPLAEFTQGRNELAEHLQKEGKDDEARRVKALRKPALPAWAVNQLARDEPESIKRLLRLRDEMASFSSPDDLRRLAGEKRGLLSSLIERAREILEQAGHSAGATTTDAIAKTLQAGASEEERSRIQQGTLDRPLAPTGFESMTGFEIQASDSPEPALKPDRGARRKAEKLSKEAVAAEREALRLGQQAEQASRQADELGARAERARQRAEDLRARAEDAINGVDD